MATTNDILIRINANGFKAVEISRRKDFSSDDIYANIISLLSFKRRGQSGKWLKGDQDFPLSGSTFKIWCMDGQRHDIQVFYHEEGLESDLLPNHRGNAIIFAGRFLSTEFNDLDIDCNNQQLKDSYGSNFIVGDMVMKVPEGYPIPDLDIYGTNPINFITRPRMPSPGMTREYGAQTAKHMMSHNTMKMWPETMEEVMNPKWEQILYELFPEKCSSKCYITLLRSWGIDVPKNVVVRNMAK